jgi:hypothetical protein
MEDAIDLQALAAHVARNCLVADAHRWGHFSLCGLLLRLRELYKREAGLPPWAAADTATVLPWVGDREAAWAALEEAPYEPLRVGGREIDALDEDAVNAGIAPARWLYVAGHGPGGHPLFVLGEIVGRREADGCEVYVLGRELVHDLVPVPAMCRPGRIVARRAAALGHLWATIEEAAGARAPGPAADALAGAGAALGAVAADPAAHEALLGALADVLLEAAIAHELGELAEERRGGGRWEALVLHTCGTKAEMTARALRDALADAGDGGLFDRLIVRRDRIALALRAAAGTWLMKKLLPEARTIWASAREGDWVAAEALRCAAAARLEAQRERLFGLFADDPPHEEAVRRADAFEKEIT